jgi:outer membrane protein assembly factor BamB
VAQARLFLSFAIVTFGNPASGQAPSDWPQFRGRYSDGHAAAVGLPTSWGGFFRPFEWQTKLPGRGWSSPIVLDQSIWLTAAEVVSSTTLQAQERLAFNPEGPLYFQSHSSVTLFAVEVELSSGKLLSKIDLFSNDSPPPIHGMNSYASPTPASDDRVIVFHFGSLGTAAIDRSDRRILWKKTFPVEDITGPGSSPLIVDEKVLLANDGADEQYILALDRMTGETLWKTSRPPMEVRDKEFRRAFSTPIVLEQPSDDKQILSSTAQWMVSYAPENGRERWRCRLADGYSLVPQPAISDGIVYVATGFMKPELYAIRTNGRDDVSETHVVWKQARQAPELASPIIIEDSIYTISTRGVLSCLDKSNGAIRWQQRLEGTFVASPIYADGKLFIVNQSGVTFVIQPGDQYAELGRNETFGETQATPVAIGDRLLIRTDPVLYSIRATDR